MDDELISPTKAAVIAQCHQDTVRRAIEFGYLPAQRVGRTWAIKHSDLLVWMQAGKPNHRRKSTKKIEGRGEQPTESQTGDT